MIETVDLPELTAIGIVVEAPWSELHRAVPTAWTRLFETDTGATSFLEASLWRDAGIYRELVGYLAAKKTEVPPGMERHTIPAGRYLKLIHDGPLIEIAGGFDRLLTHARLANLETDQFKLDFGYLPGLPAGRHELYLRILPPPLRLA